MTHIAVLASTRGSILPALFSADIPDADFTLLLTNRKDCLAREKAQQAGIPDFFLSQTNKTREQWDTEAVSLLQSYNIDLIILVGYMRILSPVFLKAFSGRILNIHPSLLPLHAGGMNMSVHQEVLDACEQETGATVHLVTEEVDAGKILLQERVPVRSDDTAESLQQRVQELEKTLYPKAISLWKELV